jgi:hypothetical protein
VGDPSNPGGASDLLLDSAGRSIFVTEAIDAVGARLGLDFVRFQVAAVHPSPCFVNRRGWVSVNPHPQVPNVTQIHGDSRYIAVQGTVAARSGGS